MAKAIPPFFCHVFRPRSGAEKDPWSFANARPRTELLIDEREQPGTTDLAIPYPQHLT
jgi:hypothetical protein